MMGATDPTTTPLYQGLHRTECTMGTLNPATMLPSCNMPLTGYTFTDGEVDEIVAWIKAGAPNN